MMDAISCEIPNFHQSYAKSSRNQAKTQEIRPKLTKSYLPGPPYAYLNSKDIINALKTIKDCSRLLSFVPDGLKENRYFIVQHRELSRQYAKRKKIAFKDDSGPWDYSRSHSVTHHFIYNSGKFVHMKDGKYCMETKKDKKRMYVPLDPQPSPSSVLLLHSYYVKHKSCNTYRRRVTWFSSLPKDMPPVAVFEYLGCAPASLKKILGTCPPEQYNGIEMTESTGDQNAIFCDGNPSPEVITDFGIFENQVKKVDTYSSFLDPYEVLDTLKLKVFPLKSLPFVPVGLKENRHYIVNNSMNIDSRRSGRKCCYWDDSGPWTSHSLASFLYLPEHNKLLRRVTNLRGEYCVEQRLDGEKVYVPLSPQPNPDTMLLLHQSSARHKDSNDYRRRVTWLEGDSSDLAPVACYEYRGSAPQSIKESLLTKATDVFEISESSDSMDIEDDLTVGTIQKVKCDNGGYALSHPGGKFLCLYEVISVLQMAGISEDPLDTVPCGLKENQYFIVDNTSNLKRQETGLKNIFWDDCGAWDAKSTRVNTEKYLCGPGQKLTRVIYMQGEFCIERQKDGNRVYIPLSPQPDPDTLLIIHRNFSKHALSATYRRKVTWLESSGKNFPLVACYEYLGKFPGYRPHGSSKNKVERYIRTRKRNIPKIKETVKPIKPCDENQKLTEGSVYMADDPKSQQQSRNYQFMRKKKTKNSSFGTKGFKDSCENLESIILKHPYVQKADFSKGNLVLLIMYKNDQMLKLKQFCCNTGSEKAVLSFSKMSNVMGRTLTLSSFKYLALSSNGSKKCVQFPGPLLLHEKSDLTTYLTFLMHIADELGGPCTQLLVEVEEEAMQRAFDLSFPNGKRFYPIQDLQKEIFDYFKGHEDISENKRNLIKELVFGNKGIVNATDSVSYLQLINKTQMVCDELSIDLGDFFRKHVSPHLQTNFDFLLKTGIPSSILSSPSYDWNELKKFVGIPVDVKSKTHLRGMIAFIADLQSYIECEYCKVKECTNGINGTGSFLS